MNFGYWGIPRNGNRKDFPDTVEQTGGRVTMGNAAANTQGKEGRNKGKTLMGLPGGRW
jgi:hypothetical protein